MSRNSILHNISIRAADPCLILLQTRALPCIAHQAIRLLRVTENRHVSGQRLCFVQQHEDGRTCHHCRCRWCDDMGEKRTESCAVRVHREAPRDVLRSTPADVNVARTASAVGASSPQRRSTSAGVK
jgi:hypothetical protein